MTKFQTIFGIKESEIKDTCILMPLLPKGALDDFGVKKISKGKIYSCGITDHFTLINTGMGPALTGDAALYLADTDCRKLILFGSCGLIKPGNGLDIGSLVMPSLCYSIESFTGLLLKNQKLETCHPDKHLLENFLNSAKDLNIQKVTCATLGSLKLEEENTDLFAENNIQVVDMECSSLFSAARYKNLKAIALFYVTDIINKKPFYAKLSDEDQIRLPSSIKTGIRFLCNFTR